MQYPPEVRLLAACLYEIRLVLASYVGASELTPQNVAATIAYAVHDDALAIVEGRDIDIDAVRRRLAFWDEHLGSGHLSRIDEHLKGGSE